MRTKFVLYSCIFFILSACNNEEKLALVLDSYIGYKSSLLVQTFGRPSVTSSGTDKVYRFEFIDHDININPNITKNSLYTPSVSGSVGDSGGRVDFNSNDYSGSYSLNVCNLSFNVNSSDLVTSRTFSGNDCYRFNKRHYVNNQFITDLQNSVRKSYGFELKKSSKGALVKNISMQSDAYSKGLRNNDLIISINEKEIAGHPSDYAEYLLNQNSTAKLKLLKKKEESELTLSKSDIARSELLKKSKKKFLGFS